MPEVKNNSTIKRTAANLQNTDIRRQIVEKGVKQLLDEAKVPMRQHFAIIQKLQGALKNHKDDIQQWAGILKSLRTEIKSHKETKKEYEKLIDGLQLEVERYHSLAKGDQGEQGDKGRDGKTPIKGKHYFDGAKGEKGDKGDPGDSFNTDGISTLLDEKLKTISIEDLANVPAFTQRLRSSLSRDGFLFNGKKIKFEELMHGGGVQSSSGGGGGAIFVETPNGAIDGVNTLYTTQNPIGIVVGLDYNGEAIHPAEYTVSGASFTMLSPLPVVSGAAFTIEYQGTSTIPTGTGINPQVPTGTINGSNKIFVAIGKISVISADGQVLTPTVDYSVLYNSGTNQTTITYVLAPQSSVYAF